MASVRSFLSLACACGVAAACSSFTAVPVAEENGRDASTLDAAPEDGGWKLAFAEGFEDDIDAGWRAVVDPISDMMTIDAGQVGAIFLGDEGRDSARALHSARASYTSASLKSLRWERSLDPSVSQAQLSFSVLAPEDALALSPEGRTQLGVLALPGLFLYPGLTQGGLDFSFETDHVYRHVPSKAPFALGVWHTVTLEVDRDGGRLRATIDGKDALAESAVPGNTGSSEIGIGLRTEKDARAVTVRYDDVVVRYR